MTPLPGPSALQIIGYIISFIFPFWPFLIISQGLQGRGKIRFKRVVNNMLAFWGLLCLGKLLLLIFSLEEMVFFSPIPEPLSTILFFITGIILVVIWILWRKK